MTIRILKMLQVQKMMMVVLILASMATPGLSGGRDVAAQGSSPIPGSSGEAVEGVTDDWWAAAKANIEEDLGLSGIDGLGTNPNWTAVGQYNGDRFGFSVAGAGDVNGDGYGDIIVGAYDFAGLLGNGKAYAFYGSASGLSTTPDWSTFGNGAGSFGYAVAGAGDVNGDGYADVVISAPFYLVAGTVYVYYGSGSGLSTSWSWRAIGEYDDDRFGISVAGAGDVNRDGYADLIVGADYYGNFVGKVYVYHGSASGPDTTWNWSKQGDTADLYFGQSVAGAGDVNGDGFDDVIMSTTAYFSGRGVAYLYQGAAGGLETDWSWTDMGENANDWFGRSVASAGDFNGDGYSDVIIGADGYDSGQDDDGKAYIYYGAEGGLSFNPGWHIEGMEPGVQDQLGRSVASAGDVNGDGFADVIIGCKNRALVVHGAESAASGGWPSWFPFGENSSDEFGYSVAGAGDVNGDGYADVIVGAYGYEAGTDKGKAYVYHGAGTSPHSLDAWSQQGTYTGDEYGWTVASAGDVNGDYYSDLLVGAPGYPAPSEKGRVYLYLGAADGLATTHAWSADGEMDGDRFGNSLAAAGDVNGDGYGDVMIGAETADGTEADVGKTYVYYGDASGLETTWAWSDTGESFGACFGCSLSSAGDVNGDGYGDVIIGAYHDGPWQDRGTAHAYYGSETGLSPAPDWTVDGEADFDRFGRAVAGAGDVNGDGYADVIVGTRDFGTLHGKAYVFHGGPSGLSTSAAWNVTGLNQSDRVGYSVAGAGDVNGDGYADVLVSALKSPEADNPGTVYGFHGSANGLSETANWVEIGESNGDRFGYSMAGAGDVNGDGYADAVIGAYGASSYRGKIYVYLGSAAGLGSVASMSDLGDQEGDQFGYSAAGAGDLNGDGYAEIVGGAPYGEGAVGVNVGEVYVYLGNARPGRQVVPQQARTDSVRTPVQPWGLSHLPDGVYLGLWATHPLGRGRAKLEVEACPPGVPFGDTDCTRHRSSSWRDTTATETGVLIATTFSGLASSTLYRWRARVLYAPYAVARVGITPPPNPAHGPWRRIQAQVNEGDVRTVEWRVFLPVVMREYEP